MDHATFEQTHSGSHTTVTRIQARRCVGGTSGKDEAQIEIGIRSTPREGKRCVQAFSSFILSPEEARRLALAICPELDASK